MKIIQSKNYRLSYVGQGQQSNDDKVKDLISQGIDAGMAIRIVYPDLLPEQVESLKKYYAKRL